MMFFKSNKSDSSNLVSKGFTLIELMVTIGIFVFMTAVVMAKYNSFYSGTIFKNLAYDVALTIRQAQTYGISVKVTTKNSISDFNAAYGVHFQIDTTADSKKFRLSSFVRSLTTPYPFVENEIEKSYNIKNGASFSGLDLSSNGTDYNTPKNFVSVVFQRPNPEAVICAKAASVDTFDCTTFKSVRITLKASDGATRYIYVNNAGQIRIDNS